MSGARDWLARLFGLPGDWRVRHPRPSKQSDKHAAELERSLGYHFSETELLWLALTHPSAAEGSNKHYERLEFLGDAVLDLSIADLLMRQFPQGKEGLLSKQRASIVNARTLAAKAEAIGVAELLKLGRGEEKSGGRQKVSILAAAFEALIGAIYKDGGLEPALRVVERLFAADIGGPSAERDYKTELQEAAYRHYRTHPVYELIAESGPDHAKRFTTRIRIGTRQLGVGDGASKKQSEQAAAREALTRIEAERGGRIEP